MSDFQIGNGEKWNLGTGTGICMLRAGRPGPLKSGHRPWPGNFSIRHILTHSRIYDWLY